MAKPLKPDSTHVTLTIKCPRPLHKRLSRVVLERETTLAELLVPVIEAVVVKEEDAQA